MDGDTQHILPLAAQLLRALQFYGVQDDLVS